MKSIDLNSEVSGGGPYDGLDKPSVKYYQASTLQKVAGIIAFGTAVASMVMTAIWMANSQTDKMYLGGLNWDDLVFNWHPVLMVSFYNNVQLITRYLVNKRTKLPMLYLIVVSHRRFIVFDCGF